MRSLVFSLIAGPALAALAAVSVGACGSDDPRTDDAAADGSTGPGDGQGASSGASGQGPSATLDDELPWEVVTEHGETVLPNVYYADASQNEQVMPHTVEGHAQIDRVVYPTLGNPNLYLRDDDTDSLLVVLRLEDAALAHLAPTLGPLVPKKTRHVLQLTQDEQNRLSVYLVPRGGRAQYTTLAMAIPGGSNARLRRIQPTEIQIDPIAEDLPEVLAQRRTIRLVFRKDALADVPADLYDLRFEVLQGGLAARDAEKKPIVEWQYNAVRIYDSAPDEYSVINMTDTQLSMSDVKTGDSRAQLRNFVDYVNAGTDATVRDALFVTFNGDLHNGGSILTFRQRAVANTYRDEAAFAVSTLRELRKPIFLTAGNHDGYSSTGIAPAAVVDAEDTLGTRMNDVVNDAQPSPWPNFSVEAFQAYRDSISETPGGHANDLFVGSFVRRAGERSYSKAFLEIPRTKRNMVLYDGFHQWQRTYGPLNFSFSFKNNHYINLNSYDLRQHVRSGWGMYAVNYGGGLGAVQEEWVRRELASHTTDDVVILAHHDPRGGHNGVDHGYYFAQLAYNGVQQSMSNYLLQEIWNPAACTGLPGWARPESTTDEECVHDGLQEWMGPDLRFDCGTAAMDDKGACRADLMANPSQHAYRFGAYQLVDLLAKTPNIRTMMLGHTHMNTLEVLRQGQVIVPIQFTDEQLHDFASLEVQNPARGYAWQSELSGQRPADYDPEALPEEQIESRMRQLRALYEGAGRTTSQTLAGDPNRELVILRTTCTAELTSQDDLAGTAAVGFAVLSLDRKSDARGVQTPQVNRVHYYQQDETTKYRRLGEVDVPRTKTTSQFANDNPLRALYEF